MKHSDAARPAAYPGARVLLLLPLLLLAACAPAPETWHFEGATMGTTYHITVFAPPAGLAQDAAGAGVDAELQRIDALMSTWKPDSEVSRFNREAPGTWFPVSPETLDVVTTALAVYRASDGAFDITVGPLVDLWGFGAGAQAREQVPAPAQVATARAGVGSAALRTRASPPALLKEQPREIDLSAIAKGYGVDRAALWLDGRGVRNYMVEVGGEVRVAGHNPDGKAWRIGIEAPDGLGGAPVTAIAVNDRAVATSGDYRNYFEQNGKRYSHTLDPRTGRPIEHGIASITVVATDCKTADALATAIDVLGPDPGLAMAERDGIPALMLVRTAGGFEQRHSSAFAPYLE